MTAEKHRLDLSTTTDISALVLVFPEGGAYSVLPFFFVPEEGARQRERRDRIPYGEWLRGGYLEATPGEAVDYDRIRIRMTELGRQYHISQVVIDRWNATQLATQLASEGFQRVAFGQGYASMSAPTKKLEEVVSLSDCGTADIQCSGGWRATSRSSRMPPTIGSRRKRRAVSGSMVLWLLSWRWISPHGSQTGKAFIRRRGIWHSKTR